jgi:acetyl-CoA carboxylase biotin carboxyl carrier protein
MTTVTVLAPLPGTFYRRPAPDQEPFTTEGAAVAVGDTLGLIEVMKTFTPVTAEQAGQVARFLVDDQDAVMAGQPLYELKT